MKRIHSYIFYYYFFIRGGTLRYGSVQTPTVNKKRKKSFGELFQPVKTARTFYMLSEKDFYIFHKVECVYSRVQIKLFQVRETSLEAKVTAIRVINSESYYTRTHYSDTHAHTHVLYLHVLYCFTVLNTTGQRHHYTHS